MQTSCAVGACGSAPELRLAGETASPASLAEGRRLLEEGRAVEAASAFRRHLRENGSDLKGLNGLAIAYGELGRPDLAAEIPSEMERHVDALGRLADAGVTAVPLTGPGDGPVAPTTDWIDAIGSSLA